MLLQKMRLLLIMITLLFLLITGAVSQSNMVNDFSERFSAPVETGQIQANELSEASGMVASIKNKGKFWVINDSGNAAKIFLIDKTGAIIRSYLLKNIRNIDWEDIAIMVDGKSGKPKIVIADIGDNMAVRDHISVILLDEPELNDADNSEISSYEIYHLKYEDGARDAETLLIDQQKKVFYIVTKREEQVRIYQSPPFGNSKNTMSLKFLQTIDLKFITSGAISADGTELLLKNYNSIYYWQKSKHQSLLEALNGKHELLNYVPEPQGESICWSLDGSGFYTLSEKSWSDRQTVYFYERKDE